VVPGRDRGHGLSVMRSRAEAEGGHLSVESSPGSGTAVAATFPLERS
jgi:signal transduction histidine kinase